MGWVFYAALSAVLAGLVAIFGKVGIRGVDNTLATAVRAGVMFGALVLLLLARGTLGEVRSLSWHPLLFILLSGLAGAGSWLC
jgi:transporter family protein